MTHSFPTRRASDLHSMAPLAIGAAPQGSYRWDGEIDDARIWNAARTPAQIAESASVPLTGNETGLVGYWRFDEATGRTAADSSPSGRSEEHTSELQSLMRISYAVFCLKKKK